MESFLGVTALVLEKGGQTDILRIKARMKFCRGNRRYPHLADGGEIAARLDRFLGLLVVRMGYEVVTAHLDVRYRKPIEANVIYPLDVEYRCRGRAHQLKARLIKNGSVAVEVSAVFLPFGGVCRG